MRRDFSGLNCLIVGGTSGIGYATGLRLQRDGAQVLVIGRRDRGPVFASQYLSLDSAAADASAEVCRWLDEVGEPIDIVVHCIGVMSVGFADQISAEVVRDMVETNLVAFMQMSAVLVPRLKESATARGLSDLVVLGSRSASIPQAGRSAYSATKAGLKAYVRVLREELSGSGVRLTYVEPGLTMTGIRRNFSTADTALANSVLPTRAAIEGGQPPTLQAEHVAETIFSALSLPVGAAVTEMLVEPYE